MKNTLLTLLVFALILPTLHAQDEGTIVKRERIERNKNIFFGGGVSIINDKNLSEYSKGFNFEGGYMKRLNRILSIGGSFSYLSFAYDPAISKGTPVFGKYPSNFYSGYNVNGAHVGAIINFNGSTLTFTSLAFNLKVNFVPIKDNSVISVYGFAKPFISISKHSDINISLDTYQDSFNTNFWTPISGGSVSDVAKVDSQTTGGIFIGPGIEIYPTKPISFFLQASFGYTFSSDFISTKSYPRDLTVLDSPTFPAKSIGFTSINFAGGISINLD